LSVLPSDLLFHDFKILVLLLCPCIKHAAYKEVAVDSTVGVAFGIYSLHLNFFWNSFLISKKFNGHSFLLKASFILLSAIA